MNHSFDVDIAVKHGVNEAIFIENLRFWVAKNQANKKHFYDGRYWTYNSMKAYAELFPYWTAHQVRRIIENLIDQGVIITGNYNQNTYDRTQWYTLKAQMHLADLPNGSGKSAKSTNTDINTDNNTITSPDKLETCPTEKIVQLYNQTLHELPSVKLMTDKRKKAIGKFWRFVLTSKKSDGKPRAENSEQALDWIDAYFLRVLENDFLMGKTGRTGEHSKWQCDLDYLLTDKGMTQVIEKTRSAE
jgi:hypothetical protein